MTRKSAIRAAASAPLGALALALAVALAQGGAAGAQSRQERPGGGHAGAEAQGGRGGAYPERRGGAPGYPGPAYYGAPAPPFAPAPYQPPRYPAPPPRRPEGAVAGWRPAQRTPPGLYSPYRAPTASLGWVIESIGRRSPGRVLDARVEDLAGRPVYRVLWLTAHGRRTDYIVDAETGAVLSGR